MEVIRAYNVGTTLYFPLIDKGATDFEATPVTIASGDCKISKDGGSFSNTGSNFAHVAGGIYSLALTGTELSCKVAVVKIVDQTNPKEWEDQCIVIMTVNHASAEIPKLWSSLQDTAAGAITASSLASDTITAAKIAADAIGASELAADAVTEIQSGLSTLTQANVRSAVGLASANLDTQLAAIAAYIDTEVAAIKAKTDNLPAAPAATGDIPTTTQIADAILSRSVENTEDSAAALTLTGAILKLCSRFVASNGRTYKSDGTTVFMTQTPSVDPDADPVTELGVAS